METFDLGAEAAGTPTLYSLVRTPPIVSVFPLVIVIAIAPAAYPGRALIQYRTKANASSDFGIYSNISGRVTNTDYLSTHEYNEFVSLDGRTYVQAAAREIEEEVGILVGERDLELVASFVHRIHDRLAEVSVVTANLDRSLTGLGSSHQPALLELSPVTVLDIERLIADGRCNTILTERFSVTFRPILMERGVN